MRAGLYSLYVDDIGYCGLCEVPWADVQGDRDEWQALHLEVQREPKMLLRLPNWKGILRRLFGILPFQHECELTVLETVKATNVVALQRLGFTT